MMTKETTAIAKYDRALGQSVGSLANVRSLLYAHQDDIAPFLPKWTCLTVERVISTAIAAVDQSPAKDKLLRCTGASVLRAVRDAVEFGLSFAKPLGQAYLIPWKTECGLMIGYRGLTDLVRRAADVKVFDSGVVYEGEVFEAVKGDKPSLRHVQRLDVDRSDDNVVGSYAIAFYENKHPQFEILNLGQIKKIRATSKSPTRGPWAEWFGEKARISAIRRLAKLLPVSAEKLSLMARVFEHEHKADGLAAIPEPSPADRLDALKDHDGTKPPDIEGKVEVEVEVPADTTDAPGEKPADALPDDDNRTVAHCLLRCIAANAKPKTTYADELTLLNARALGAIRGTAVVDYDPKEAAKAVEALTALCKDRKYDAAPFLPDGPDFKPLLTAKEND